MSSSEDRDKEEKEEGRVIEGKGGREGGYFETPEAEQRFLEWFWKGRHGNDLIKALNAYAQGKKLDDRIRREKESPVIYAVVLNDGTFPFEANGEQWKLCKIGFTHRSVKRGSNNRMEQEEMEIIKEYNTKKKEKDPKANDATASTLFALRIGAVDTTSYHETETRIREKVGKPLRKEKAKELNLPNSTEWVLTTQKHINEIRKKIEKKDAVSLDLFKEIKTTPTPPEEWPNTEHEVNPKPKSSLSSEKAPAKKKEGKTAEGESSRKVEKESKRKAKSSSTSLAAAFSLPDGQ